MSPALAGAGRSIKNVTEPNMTLEQFLREGVRNPRSPWIAYRRQLFLSVLFFVAVTGVFVYIFKDTALYLFENRAILNDISSLEQTLFIGELQMSGVFVLTWALIILPVLLRGMFGSREVRHLIRIWRERGLPESVDPFPPDTYGKATDVLRSFKPKKYRDAVRVYGQDVVELLLVAGALFFDKEHLKRLVSIKSIEEDREAGPDDE